MSGTCVAVPGHCLGAVRSPGCYWSVGYSADNTWEDLTVVTVAE